MPTQIIQDYLLIAKYLTLNLKSYFQIKSLTLIYEVPLPFEITNLQVAGLGYGYI